METIAGLVVHRIPDAYLVVGRLQADLDAMFGANSYKIMMKRSHCLLYLPRALTASELRELSRRTRGYNSFKEYKEYGRQEKLQSDPGKGNSASNDARTKAGRQRPSTSDPSNREVVPGTSSNEQPSSPAEDEIVGILKSVPSYYPSGDTGNWFHMVAPTLGSKFTGIALHAEGNGRSTSGIYSVEIDSGESSKIYNVEGKLLSSVAGSDQPVVRKFAIKQLKKLTSPEDFLREYNALKYAQSLNHPNVVELLSVFKSEDRGAQHFNFAFPLALGNLKRLFFGHYDQSPEVIAQTSFLWPQMVGLASAVTFLHESAHTAHRDVKPSNILIYQDSATRGLVLKLTDFGLAIDLTRALTWQEGSAAAMSALHYDSPEMRLAFTHSKENKFQELPSPKQLLSNDIWKLGCVFTELAAFIVGGSAGVTEFRDAITTETGNISSDAFNDVRFDDGERVKPEVMAYIKSLGPRSREIHQIEPILHAMLAETSMRPTAREVCQLLVDTSLIKYPYNDGIRRVSLRPEKSTPGHLDYLRLKFERSFANPIDWSPMPPIVRPCRKGEVRVAWQSAGRELSVVLSKDEGLRYASTCVATFMNGAPILPISNQNISASVATNSMANNPAMPSQISIRNVPDVKSGQVKSPGQPVSNSVSQNLPMFAKKIYWCVDEVFSEPKETWLRPVAVSIGVTDERFYELTNRALNKARGGFVKGWLLDCLSWKRCVGVDFRQFHIVKTNRDQVLLGQVELPPQTHVEYEHGMLTPEDVHMKLAAVQMVAGLMDPKTARGEKIMTTMLPKKKIPPDFKREMGMRGWGIYAQMGFSVKKILWWLIFCMISMLVFAVVWLVCINSTDLQNAFVPATLVLTMFTIVLGVAQVLG